MQYPIALEGALKLKEISYIHAEGLPAAEMKHGPIALINPDMPVVVIAVRDHLYEKVISNIEEVRSRGGRVIALATEGDEHIGQLAEEVLYLPDVPEAVQPFRLGGAAATAGVPRGGLARLRRGQAAEPGEVGHGRVRYGA